MPTYWIEIDVKIYFFYRFRSFHFRCHYRHRLHRFERSSIHQAAYKHSTAEVGQVIAGTKFVSFLKPDKTLKNDARHDIDWSELVYSNALSGIVFWRNFWPHRLTNYVPASCNHLPNFGKRAFIQKQDRRFICNVLNAMSGI